MSDTTDNLGLIIPEVPGANPSEAFDWEEFIRNNFTKIDGMAVLGGTHIVNAAEFTTAGEFSMSTLLNDSVVNTYLSDGLFIYFPPGTYSVISEDGMKVGVSGDAPVALHIFGAKGAVIDASGSSGEDVEYMLEVKGITDVTITGLTFKGKAADVSTTATIGILAEHAERLHINDCTLYNLGSAIKLDEAGTDPTEKVWIENCTIFSILKDIIISEEALDVFIINNYINANTGVVGFPGSETLGDGILITPGVATNMNNIVVDGNTIIGTRRNAIKLLANADAGEAPTRFQISNNVILNPGNFVDETSELTKATRGSGIYAGISGTNGVDLFITDNKIVEPLSHGIYVDAIDGAVVVRNNSVDMGYVRPSADTDDSWHGIYVANSSEPPLGAIVTGNVVDIKWTASSSYQAEERYGIFLSDCNFAQFTNNTSTGRCYIYSSDDATITGNNIDSTSGGWSGTGLLLKGEAGDTSDRAIISGNVVAGSTHDIEIQGNDQASRSATVIGNQASLEWTNSAAEEDGAYTFRQAFNKYRAGDEDDIISHPKYRLDVNGIVQHGRYSEVHWIPATEWFPDAAQCNLEFIESLTPALTFDGTGADAAAYATILVPDYDHTADNGLTVEVLLSADDDGGAGDTARMNLGYYLTKPDAGTVTGFSYTDIGLVSVSEGVIMDKIKFTIPDAALAADTAKTILFLKLWRDVDDGNDDLQADVNVYGVRISWDAIYDGKVAEMP